MARKRYFVRRGFQGRFIAAFVALALFGAIATAVAAGLAADRTLEEALFRAHFSERSTRDLLLPVLLKVNGAAAVAMIVGGILVALVLFARQARALDALCSRLARWRRELGAAAEGPAPASVPAPSAAAFAPGWAADLDAAFRDAESALHATYRSSRQDASALAADAARLERSVGEDGAKATLPRDLAALGERLGRIEATLAQYQPADRP